MARLSISRREWRKPQRRIILRARFLGTSSRLFIATTGGSSRLAMRKYEVSTPKLRFLNIGSRGRLGAVLIDYLPSSIPDCPHLGPRAPPWAKTERPLVGQTQGKLHGTAGRS